MTQGEDEFEDRDVSRLTSQLDKAITLKRRTAAEWRTVQSNALPALPIRPSSVELAVLTTLARTYGSALFDEPHFAAALDCIAERGAAVLVQRALWGEQREDMRLALQLEEARIQFERLCSAWPHVFFAQARAVLARTSWRPPLPLEDEGDN
ncbi:hypothetical protein AWB75_04476 [Caballeronia catudaia]|uniref:Uncharacterized protein n=1 Tax=Caballeronia catudaia TaxID=1777136 RepID=A0A158C486_9BURK|nr:hypothetical protein [Caballeronia catudaia]SAK77090.1 hypothetical protein AWB75_04476 [Caballeronia catudaia]